MLHLLSTIFVIKSCDDGFLFKVLQNNFLHKLYKKKHENQRITNNVL